MYRIDLETLLYMLEQRSGLLEASSSSISGMKGRCQVTIELVKGVVTTCTIRDGKGNVLSGKQALSHLKKKTLDWEYRDAPPPVSPSSPSLHRLSRETSPLFHTFSGEILPDGFDGKQAPHTGPLSPGSERYFQERPISPPEQRHLPVVTGPPSMKPDAGLSPAQDNKNRLLSSFLQAVPRHVFEPSPQQFQTWPRQYRAVFLLIDGTRTIETIARLLQHDAGKVLLVIREMVTAGIVRWQ